jgi:phospholipid:diacylglycerol acyltransferase
MTPALRRRRLGPRDTPEETDSLRDQSPSKLGDKAEILPEKPKTRKRRNTAIFLLGSLFGILAAGFFAKSNDLIIFPEIGELNMGALYDVLPAGLVREMRDLVVSTAARPPTNAWDGGRLSVSNEPN